MVGAIKIISQKRPQGGTIPKGLSYRQNEDKVFPLNCPAKQASPSMTAFLDQNTWLNAQTPSSGTLEWGQHLTVAIALSSNSNKS